eukprot:8774216-Pyramimonas_sp.AAC.1
MGIISRQTNQTQEAAPPATQPRPPPGREAREYSHDGANRTQDASEYSHDGPIGRRTRGSILTTDQSDAGSAGIFSHREQR